MPASANWSSCRAERASWRAGVSASLGASGMAEVCCRIEQHIADGLPDTVLALIDDLELRLALTRAELYKLGHFDL